MIKKKIIIVISPLLIFFAVCFFSLIKCEVLTLMHGNQFIENYKTNTMIEDIEYCKVVKYSQTQALVYYVSDKYSRGDTVTFIKVNGNWEYESWNTVWSTSGSADNFIWPYWWHLFYSHPRL